MVGDESSRGLFDSPKLSGRVIRNGGGGGENQVGLVKHFWKKTRKSVLEIKEWIGGDYALGFSCSLLCSTILMIPLKRGITEEVDLGVNGQRGKLDAPIDIGEKNPSLS